MTNLTVKQQVASDMYGPSVQTGNIHNCPDGAEECPSLKLNSYIFALAARLKEADSLDDADYLQQLWETYGYRTCMKADHIRECHPELMPDLADLPEDQAITN